MVRLFGVELTPSGRPVLLPGEVERGMLDKVRASVAGKGACGGHGPARFSLLPFFLCCPASQPRSTLQIDVLFYGRGGVEEHPAEEYKAGPRAAFMLP